MPLTAIEIKQQKFAKTMRGCDPAEVKAFLSLAASEWEHLIQKNQVLTQQVEDLEDKLDHYKKVEKDLHETLKNARESIKTKLDSANQHAEHTIEKAETRAESIIRDAEQERKDLYTDVLQLHNRRREIAGSIRSYLKAAMDSVDHFEKEQAKQFNLTEESPKETSTKTDPDSDEQANHSKPSHKTPPSHDELESIDELIDGLE